jgi:hypothetical protein
MKTAGPGEPGFFNDWSEISEQDMDGPIEVFEIGDHTLISLQIQAKNCLFLALCVRFTYHFHKNQ